MPQLNSNPFEVLRNSSRNTPDFKVLKKKPVDEFIVFVYGNCKRGRHHNFLLKDCNNYGSARTYYSEFILKREEKDLTLRKEPFLFKFDSKNITRWWGELKGKFLQSDISYVEGQVYGVPLRALTNLDKYHKNFEGMLREEIYVELTEQKANPSVKAWAYVVDFDFFVDVVDDVQLANTNTIKTYKNNSKEFESYYF